MTSSGRERRGAENYRPPLRRRPDAARRGAPETPPKPRRKDGVMRRILPAAATIAAVAAVAAGTASAGPGTTLVIRHQLRGCHSWSYAGGAYRPAQTVRLRAGSTITVIDDDVMPHTLVQLAGPRV